MSTYNERYEAQRNEWKSTYLRRLNHGYGVLCAKRSRLSDDNPKKHGSFLKALGVFERKIRSEDAVQEIIMKGYFVASELGDAELAEIYGRSVNSDHQCDPEHECFCCICGRVIADRKAGKEQAFPFTEG